MKRYKEREAVDMVYNATRISGKLRGYVTEKAKTSKLRMQLIIQSLF